MCSGGARAKHKLTFKTNIFVESKQITDENPQKCDYVLNVDIDKDFSRGFKGKFDSIQLKKILNGKRLKYARARLRVCANVRTLYTHV